MRNKILTVLGLLIMAGAIGSYFFFDTAIRQNSEVFGATVLVAKRDIAEGTVIRSVDQAADLFTVKRVPQVDLVPGAVVVENTQELSFFQRARSWFTVTDAVSTEGLKALVNRRVIEHIRQNEQVVGSQLSTDLTEFEADERLFAVAVTYLDAVGGEVRRGDWVDLWVAYRNDQGKIRSEKIIGPLQVERIKNDNNQPIEGNSTAMPEVAIFKLNEAQIKTVSEWMRAGTVFLTKHGVTPSNRDAAKIHVTDPAPAPQPGTVLPGETGYSTVPTTPAP